MASYEERYDLALAALRGIGKARPSVDDIRRAVQIADSIVHEHYFLTHRQLTWLAGL